MTKRVRLTQITAEVPASGGTVGRFIDILRSLLTQYDMRWNKGNIYALGHYLEALDKVRGDVRGTETQDDPQALKRLQSSVNKRFIPDFSPIVRWNKYLEAFVASGVPPKYKAVSLRYAASPTGLYGHTRATQRDCEAAGRKLARTALRLARSAFEADGEVVPFLQAHAKREGSRSAKVLLAAMREVGPKVASSIRAGQPREAGKATHGLYGFKTRTADLGLDACKSLRSAAGTIASDLHRRRADVHEKITGFLKEHSKQGRCVYSGMLLSCYPEASMRLASVAKVAGPGAGVEVHVGTPGGGRPSRVRFPEKTWWSFAQPDVPQLDARGGWRGRAVLRNVGLASYADAALVEDAGVIDDIEVHPSEFQAFRAQAEGYAAEDGFSPDDITYEFELEHLVNAMLSAGFVRSDAPRALDLEGVASVYAVWDGRMQHQDEVGLTANVTTSTDFRASWNSLDAMERVAATEDGSAWLEWDEQ